MLKNLANTFLETAKKSNLEKLKFLIKEADINNISLDFSEALVKSSRYGRLENVKFIINYPVEISTNMFLAALEGAITSNSLPIFKELYSCVEDRDIEEIFTQVFINQKKDFIEFMLVDKEYKCSPQLDSYILNLHTTINLQEIKDFYIDLKAKIALHENLVNFLAEGASPQKKVKI